MLVLRIELCYNHLILFENQIQTTSASPCRTQVQPAALFLVCSLIFIEYKKQGYQNMKTEYQKMIAGEPYHPFDPELRALAQTARQKQAAFNEEVDPVKGMEIIKGWFGSTGENLYINTRLMVDYGVNIHLGENFYSNWNLTMLDVCPITIGDNAMIGPNCQFLTPLHPLDPDERNSGLEFGKPITIGKNFWAGGGVIVLPGVTLGDNVVAGAGAVITKSFGDNVVLAGNPARVIKEIPVKGN